MFKNDKVLPVPWWCILMLEVTDTTFKEHIEDREGLAIVDFWAEWCGPCKMFAPIFKEASEAYKNVQFAKIDVDGNNEVPQAMAIRSIPTIVFFKDGQEIDRFSGVIPKEEFFNKIQEHLK
jgi:thioredoxin 1